MTSPGGKQFGDPHLFQVGPCGVWHYRFQRGGKRIQRSTHTTDYTKAYEIALRARLGEPEKPALKDAIELWHENHERVSSAAHLRNTWNLRRHLYDLGELPVDRLTTEAVERARNQHLERYSKSSTNLWLRSLKLVLNWLIRRGVIEKLPFSVSAIRLQKKPRTVLSVEKSASWLESVVRIAGPRWSLATAVMMAFALGLREGEALGARWEWIDWELCTYSPGQTKDKKTTAIPMPSWLVDRLQDRKKDEGLISPSPRGGEYYPGATWALIKQASASVGVVGIHPHRLRANFATRLSECGIAVQDIQRLLRHRSLITTAGYLEPSLDRVAEAQERVAERLGLSGNGRRKNAEEDIASVRP